VAQRGILATAALVFALTVVLAAATTAAAARADDRSLAESLRIGMSAATQVARLRFNPFLPGSPPVETVTGKINWAVYNREAKAVAGLLARLSRLRASLIVARQSVAADSGSTASGRVARSLAIQGFGTLTRAVADARLAIEVKGQMLDNAITDAPKDAACFQGTGSCDLSAELARDKKLAARRDAAVAAFGRGRDAGMALLSAATRRLQ
jgi:hypothetical protein